MISGYGAQHVLEPERVASWNFDEASSYRRGGRRIAVRYWMYIEVDRAFRYVSADRYCSFYDLHFCAPMRPLVSVLFAFCGEGSKVANPSRQGRYPALADLACKHEGGVPAPALQCFIRLATLPGLCLSASSVPMPLASWRPAATKRPPERYTGGPTLSRRRARLNYIRLAGTPAGRFAAFTHRRMLPQAPACQERRTGRAACFSSPQAA